MISTLLSVILRYDYPFPSPGRKRLHDRASGTGAFSRADKQITVFLQRGLARRRRYPYTNIGYNQEKDLLWRRAQGRHHSGNTNNYDKNRAPVIVFLVRGILAYTPLDDLHQVMHDCRAATVRPCAAAHWTT